MKTIMIGTFPPPVHGMATINQAIFERLVSAGWDVERLDTSPQKSGNPSLHRLSRLMTFLPVWKYLLGSNLPNGRVYMALSGGWGQIYDIVTVLLCRIKGMKCVLHHHSVAYLVKKRIITSLLFQLAGRQAIHVALCKNMKKDLQQKYDCKRVVVLSNIALLCPEDLQTRRRKIQTIGYLSNITKEKGGWDLVNLASKIRERDWPIKFKIAGPCQDDRLRKALQGAHEAGDLEWFGPIYGSDKTRFLDSIDVFLFPTQYENEAEPLVVWEALLSGVPVIAYDRGCISGQVGEAGKIIPQDIDFIEAAMKLVGSWMTQPEMYGYCVEAAPKKIMAARRSAGEQWKEFILALEEEV